MGSKIVANSGYGAMGYTKEGGALTLLPGAMCTTAKGRQLIFATKEFAEKEYKTEVIYGDTDSCFLRFPNIKTLDECHQVSEQFSKDIAKIYPPPVTLEFEAIYSTMVMLTKKRYSAHEMDNGQVHVINKGLALKRRDYTDFTKRVFQKILNMIMDNEPITDMIYEISLFNRELMSHSVKVEELVLSKSYGKKYVGETCKKCKVDYDTVKRECPECGESMNALPAHVGLVHKLRRRGQTIGTGERIDYLLLNVHGATTQDLKSESPSYYQKFSRYLKLDYQYYLEVTLSQVQQLFTACYSDRKPSPNEIFKSFIKSHQNWSNVNAEFKEKFNRVKIKK